MKVWIIGFIGYRLDEVLLRKRKARAVAFLEKNPSSLGCNASSYSRNVWNCLPNAATSVRVGMSSARLNTGFRENVDCAIEIAYFTQRITINYLGSQ